MPDMPTQVVLRTMAGVNSTKHFYLVILKSRACSFFGHWSSLLDGNKYLVIDKGPSKNDVTQFLTIYLTPPPPIMTLYNTSAMSSQNP